MDSNEEEIFSISLLNYADQVTKKPLKRLTKISACNGVNCLKMRKVPDDWKESTLAIIHKKGD